MRFLLALCAALLAFAFTPPAASATTFACGSTWCGGTDGTWWQQLSPASKLAVVQSSIAAYQLAYNLGQFDTLSAWATAYESETDRQPAQNFRAALEKKTATFSKSPSAYVVAIDRFYQTYPSKLPLKVAGVLRCLQDRPEATCDRVGKSDLLPWPTGI